MPERAERCTVNAAHSGAPRTLTRRDMVKRGLSALVLPALLGCAPSLGQSTSRSRSGPRLSARPEPPVEGVPAGISRLGIGADRDGILYLPASYAAGQPAPLFVALHGAGGSGSAWAAIAPLADAGRVIVLAPDSRGATWDLYQGGYGPDAAFLDAALRHTFRRCSVDASHMALGGFSDGASGALSAGVSNGDLFGHLIAFSPGTLLFADPIVGRPRTYVAHGADDPVIPVGASRDQIVPFLRQNGYDVTYQEFSGGHTVPPAVAEAAVEWFLQ